MLGLTSLIEQPAMLPKVSVTKNKSSSFIVKDAWGLSLKTQGHSGIGIWSAGTKVCPSSKIFSGVIKVSGVISKNSVLMCIVSLLEMRHSEKDANKNSFEPLSNISIAYSSNLGTQQERIYKIFMNLYI
jgi:hypothetical protein